MMAHPDMEPELKEIFSKLGLAAYIPEFVNLGATSLPIFDQFVDLPFLKKLTSEHASWPELHKRSLQTLLPDAVKKMKRSSSEEDVPVRPLKKALSIPVTRMRISGERLTDLMRDFITASTDWPEKKHLFDGNELQKGFSLCLENDIEIFVCKCSVTKVLSERKDTTKRGIYWGNIHQHTANCPSLQDSKMQRSIDSYAMK